MALLKSQTFSQISGSVGGVTFAKSSQGMYMRSRQVPVNPASSRQNHVRDIMRNLVVRWNQTLTQAQRDGWALYARNVTRANRLGDSIKISGQNWYVGANAPRLQLAYQTDESASPVDDAPTQFDRGETGHLVIDEITTSNGATVNVNDGPAWAADDNALFALYAGKPQNASRSYYRGPYRLAYAQTGDSDTQVLSVHADNPALSDAWQYVAGQKMFLRAVVMYPDGRTSNRIDLGAAIIGT